MTTAGDATAGDVDSSDRFGRVARSTGTLVLGDLVNKAARFAAVVVLARSLPLDEFGLLNVGIAAGGIAVVVLRFGLPDLGARDVAVHPDRSAEVAGEVTGPQVVGLLVLTGVSAAAVAPFDMQAATVVLASGAAALGLSASAEWFLRGRQRMSALAVATAVGGLTALGCITVVTMASDSAVPALLALGAGDAVAAALTWRAARLGGWPRLKVSLAALRRAWPLAVTGVVTYAYYANFDTLLLGATRSAEEAGLYSAPYKLFLALTAAALFAGYSLLPAVARLAHRGDIERASALVRRSLAPLAAYGLLCVGLAELTAGWLLAALFGEAFDAMASTFVLLCAAVPWYAVGFPSGYVAIGFEHPRRLMAGAAVAAALNVTLNLALIPPFGPEGAAVATLAAMILAAVTWLVSQREVLHVPWQIGLLSIPTCGAIAVAMDAGLSAPVGLATLVLALALLYRSGNVVTVARLARR